MTYDDLERLKKSVLRKYPIQGNLAFKGIKFEITTSISTAAVAAERDEKGKLKVTKLLINPDFFDRMTYGQRVFVLAHEMCHIALKHFARSEEKPEKDIQRKYLEYCEIEEDENKRKLMKAKLTSKYQRIWNIATDACINAFLKKDGLSFPYGIKDPETGEEMKFVDMKEGMSLRAEKIYDYLVKKDDEKEEEEKKREEEAKESDKQGNGDPTDSNGSSSKNNDKDSDGEKKPGSVSIDDVDIDDYKGIDSHDEWQGSKDKDKDSDKESESKDNDSSSDSNDSKENENNSSGDEEIDDEEVFNNELESRNKKDGDGKPSLSEALEKVRKGLGLDDLNIPKKPVLSWKRLLVGALDKEEDVWGYRRASTYAPNARMEERIYDTLPQIEIVLDTSGSISSELLKGFLLQLIPLFDIVYDEKPKINVGCFSDKFYGFNEIRSKKEIADLKILGRGGTNYEAAASAFTKDPGHKITKIVFTDGAAGVNPQTDTDDVIWVVFGNDMTFKPKGGRIIKVNEDEYKDMISTGSKLIESNEQVKSKHI
jgi:predicted metal-dependent peptidase